MKTYFIDISFLDPYPVTNTYRETGSNYPASIGKALRNWRKEHKGRKIKSITIKAKQL